jgi:hypothetical protein
LFAAARKIFVNFRKSIKYFSFLTVAPFGNSRYDTGNGIDCRIGLKGERIAYETNRSRRRAA